MIQYSAKNITFHQLNARTVQIHVPESIIRGINYKHEVEGFIFIRNLPLGNRQYQTVVPGFWAWLITRLQVSQHQGSPLCHHGNKPADSILYASVCALFTWKHIRGV